MLKRISMLFAVSLVLSLSLAAQQAPPSQPLTMWADYTVNPGKEEEFMNLVKTVGAPVRDKLMAEGVIGAWGVEVPVLRGPGQATHTIWVSVNDWTAMEKVRNAMDAQFTKMAAEEMKVGKKTTMQRVREILDVSKTRDWVTRDLVSGYGSTMPKDATPYARYFFTKVKPGKATEYRMAWEKYIKPVLDKLTADGVVMAWGLGVEEVKTEGSFTHFTWVATNSLGDWDKVRAAFMADREHRSQEERDAISHTFESLTDSDAARQSVGHSIIFHVPPPPK